MTLKDFQILISNTLSSQKEICHLLVSNNSLLVSCTDKSDFYINILESKRTFIHNDQKENYVEKYIATHSDKDFANDILNLATCHPGFFLYFLLFMKLKELEVIDNSLFYHLNDSIIHYESELNTFTIELLNRLNKR